MKIKKKQKGFTMIELVIVIAILGVLAAFALPRFADFTTQSKKSRAEGIAAAFNSAVAIAKAKYISAGATGTTVTLENYSFPVDANGDLKITNGQECQALIDRLVANRGMSFAGGFSSGAFGTECYVRIDTSIITITPTGAFVKNI